MDRFVFPRSFYETIRTFKPSSREALYSAIFDFIFDDKETELKSVDLQRVWMLIFPILSKAKKISTTISRQSQDNLKTLSGDTQEKVKTISRQSPFKEKEKDKGEKERDKEKSATASSPSRFHKPTVDEVRAYIQESGYHVNPNDFVNFYESKGWLVGKSPMKDWKAAVRTWESKEKNENPAKFAEEKEDEYHPIVPLDRCHVCDSKNVSTQGLYSQCNACGVTYVWNNKKGEWREEC